MKIKNTFLSLFYKIFLLSDNMVSFISGIFISVSTGILTCVIPQSILTMGAYYIISAVLMFIASIAMMIWSTAIKPIHDIFNSDTVYGRGIGGTNDWVSFCSKHLKGKSIMFKVIICFLITALCFIGSVILWVIA